MGIVHPAFIGCKLNFKTPDKESDDNRPIRGDGNEVMALTGGQPDTLLREKSFADRTQELVFLGLPEPMVPDPTARKIITGTLGITGCGRLSLLRRRSGTHDPGRHIVIRSGETCGTGRMFFEGGNELAHQAKSRADCPGPVFRPFVKPSGAGYNFQLGQRPVSTRVKVCREFAAENHLEGTSAYMTQTIPLGVKQLNGQCPFNWWSMRSGSLEEVLPLVRKTR
ncbi:hypothetical protein [Roseibium aggregatum]|uniref:hypothetical protein n=1 Tax=Roseibium aggregatum TaxID=187304 RepID=UPI0012F4B0A9|nr:hypothetical protein [Roseibium aggregatum]